MKRNILAGGLVLLLLAVSGCKSRKAIVKAPEAPVLAPAAGSKQAENLLLLKSKDLPYTTLSLKGKVNLDLNGNGNSASVNIRMKKEEKIWLSITAFAGIEVARALITPDSLLVRNNLQSVVLRQPFSYIYRFTSREVTFTMLQAMISGNTVPELMAETATLEQANGVFLLTGEKGKVAFRALFNTFLKTAELDLNDVRAGQALKVGYSDYQDVTGALYPSVVSMHAVSGKNKTNITFDFSRIERNLPLDFPFSVPKRFETIN